MSDKTTAKRETLAKVAGLVRSALAQRDYIPALTHIRFGEGFATAYNDITAIKVASDINLNRCVPGELLIRTLGSFGGDEILIQEGKDGSLTLKSGRSSSIKLPTLPYDAFPFQWPADDEGTEVAIDAAVIKAVERCLLSVGADSGHPAQMGVTLDTDSGKAVLFSTDNYTVSRCATPSKMKLPADAPVILPRFFCEQLVVLAKAFPEARPVMVLHAGAVQVDFGQHASLLTKTPVDLVPLDFPRIISKHVVLSKVKETMSIIPDAFDSALGRALLVLGGEAVKLTQFKVGAAKMDLISTSPVGDADDSMPFENGTGAQDFSADAALLARGAKACALLAFTDKVTIMADAECNFIHLIAHTTA